MSPEARVLAIIPDKTRDDNTDLLFPFVAETLAARNIAQLDALVVERAGRDLYLVARN